MKNVTLLLFFVLLFICQKGTSQIDPEVLTKFQSKYYYQTRFYAKSELGPVLKSNPKAYKVYRRYLRDRKVHRTVTILSVGTLTLWKIWNDGENGIKCADDCSADAGKIFLSIPIITIPTIATIGTFINVFGKTKKAVMIFNEDLQQIPKTGYLPVELDFGTTTNGIGLVLSF